MSNLLQMEMELQQVAQRRERRRLEQAQGYYRPRAVALSGPVHYMVPGIVPVVSQDKSRACWAAATTMLMSWREQLSMSISDAMAKIGSQYLDLYNKNTGLSDAQKPLFAKATGLSFEPPMNYTVEGWEQLLRRYGPLWVTTATPNFAIHGRVMKGISGDGRPGGTHVYLIDPAGGREYAETVSDFVRSFEREVATTGNLRLQVGHWPARVRRMPTDGALTYYGLQASTPAGLRDLLKYLGVAYTAFSPFETRYFDALRELLSRHGLIQPDDVIDRTTFRETVRDFQRRTGLKADGIPGQDTLWALQVDGARNRNLAIRRVDADIWVRPPRAMADHDPDRDGYDRFQLRQDAAQRYQDLRNEVLAAGGMITSAGSFRPVTATVTPGRSATSFHYSGLAFDLATPSGMRDPNVDPYIITHDGDYWRVWARAGSGEERTLDAIIWSGGQTRTEAVTARVLDFTALAERHGFRRIRPRSCFPAQYLCAEWWHFQCEEVLIPWISQFGVELLSLQRYSEADLRAVKAIWDNRQRIFKRATNGWH